MADSLVVICDFGRLRPGFSSPVDAAEDELGVYDAGLRSFRLDVGFFKNIFIKAEASSGFEARAEADAAVGWAAALTVGASAPSFSGSTTMYMGGGCASSLSDDE